MLLAPWRLQGVHVSITHDDIVHPQLEAARAAAEAGDVSEQQSKDMTCAIRTPRYFAPAA